MRETRNILVMRLGGIGEILVITPALRAVREKYPDAHITLLGEEPAVQSVSSELVDEVIRSNAVYRAQGLRWILSPRFYWQMMSLVAKLTRRRFDLFLNFNHLYTSRAVLKPLLVSLLTRAPRRVGFDSYNRGWFLTDRVPDRRFEPRHLLYRNEEFLAPLGIEPQGDVEIALDSKEHKEAAGLARLWGIRNGTLVVGVHPGSSRPASQWDPVRFVEVLRRLYQEHGSKTVLIGSPAEAELCDRIAREVPDSINAAGKTSISTLTALMDYFDVFLSNDTGPMHIARARGVPTVGLFGPGEHAIWGTYKDDHFESIRRPVPCSPCYRKKCWHQTCMRLIETNDVVEAVDRVLAHEDSART